MTKAITATLTDGQEVRVLFAHNDYRKKAHILDDQLGNPADTIPPYAVDLRANRPGAIKAYSHSTMCSVVIGPREAEVSLASGESWCAVGDNFCRATGRELALKRAVENGKFGREDSGKLFAAYFNRNKQTGKGKA